MDKAEQLITNWRTVAGEEAFFSASRVQERLFDLYGEVRDLPAGRLVETWLTLTIQRDLFSGAELLELLDELQLLLGDRVSAG
ncbi:MAG: hypothetical protein M3N68_01290 [Actinomycetota bacterium]|nr:hypothetical protein [Actinomycetota bacterium]